MAAAEPSVSYRYWKAVEQTEKAGEEILSVVLDGDIYAAAADGLPDVRILDQSRAEVPYQLQQDTERKVERVRRETPSSVVSLKEQGEAIEIHTRLDKDARPAEGLSLVTQLNDFERTVHVSGSKDGQEWTPLGDGVIFDYSRYPGSPQSRPTVEAERLPRVPYHGRKRDGRKRVALLRAQPLFPPGGRDQTDRGDEH